jgi:transposase InsO family protein
VDERREFAVAALRRERSISTLCREYGISRKTGHKWLRIAREQGVRGLENRSRRPHRVQGISAAVRARVLELRQRTGYGGRLISDALRAEGIGVGHATVDRVIARAGLGPPEPRLRAAPRRFERAWPNEELWQMDFKAEYRLGGGRVVPLSLLDDYSRFVVGLYGLPSSSHEATDPAVRDCFEHYGVPEAMLMDHGTPWWSTTNGFGLTRLAVQLIEQGITLVYGGIRHPQTQGKVERFHRTLDRALVYAGPFTHRDELIAALAAIRETYNQKRPHSALGRAVPASRYAPSPRAYTPVPRRWEYPTGGFVRTLNSAGVLDLTSARYFVCEALAGKPVWCREYDHRILVTYRHMYVREIDRRTGTTQPVVAPVERM